MAISDAWREKHIETVMYKLSCRAVVAVLIQIFLIFLLSAIGSAPHDFGASLGCAAPWTANAEA